MRNGHVLDVCLLVVALLALGGTVGTVLDLAYGSEDRRPLDLPSGGQGAEVEEEAGETIEFYGAAYEGDSFVWVLDRSCSMGWGGRWGVLQAEFSEAVSQLSETSEVGAVAFESFTTVWQWIPRPATPANRASVVSWLAAQSPEGGTTALPALVQGLEILRRSDAPRHQRVLIFLSDGEPNNPGPIETLAGAVSANWDQVPINCIHIGGGSGMDFMQGLANATGGTFSAN